MFVINDNNSLEDTQKVDSYIEKLVSVKRTTKVVKGGRVFGFSALTVVGDGNGKIGVGKGKSKEVPLAIQKAMENAKRNLVSIRLNDNTIFNKIEYKYCSTKVVIVPAVNGTGIIAGDAMRSVFEVLGIKDVFSKCYGSSNPINIVKATINGLLNMSYSFEINSIRKKNKNIS